MGTHIHTRESVHLIFADRLNNNKCVLAIDRSPSMVYHIDMNVAATQIVPMTWWLCGCLPSPPRSGALVSTRLAPAYAARKEAV